MSAAGLVTAAQLTQDPLSRTDPADCRGLRFPRRVEAVGLPSRPGSFGMTMPLNLARMASGEADLSQAQTVIEFD
jgi:hypothetical protein